MKSKTSFDGNKSFFSEITHADERVLIVDYEGILAPLSLADGRTAPDPALWELLKDVMQYRTRVITVSRWPACNVASWFGIHQIPEIWGNDGLERLLANGQYTCWELHTPIELLRAIAECELRLEEVGLTNRMNTQLSGVTINWRGLTASQKLNTRVKAYGVLQPLTVAYPALRLVPFDEGFELRLPVPSKADIIQRLLDATPSNIPIAYMGHSTTDEETFRIMNGRGLTVLVRPVARFTAAQVCLSPSDDLPSFLTNWIAASINDL